ncbi:hypothetical protein N7513_006175 [Penicillium frequentans]|nr:hypothetical protein N7513_006175 [Penicillium glabrum]
MDFSALAGASLAALVSLLWWYFHVPSNLPVNIPRIPIYGWALGIWWGMSHAEVYDRWVREPLEKHGAVIIWSAGRWNILVGDPALLVELFRNHGLYTKAGNQVRVPWSVLGAFVGDNIVNAHGSNWELYTSVMKPGIQRPFDPAFTRSKSKVLVDRLIHTQKEAGSKTGVLVSPWLQKFTVDVMANYFFDLHLQSLERQMVLIEQLLTILKPAVFSFLHMNLPVLDRLPALQPSRKEAFRVVEKFEQSLYSMVRGKREAKVLGNDEVVSYLLQTALEEGKISDRQFRSNLKIIFMVGHENIQFLLTSAILEMGRNTIIQDRLRTEVKQAVSSSSDIAADTIARLPYLNAVISELLRLYPPVGQMLNRAASQPACLGGRIDIPVGASVGWNAYGLHTNPQVWGTTASEFIPERWGKTIEHIQANIRRETVRGAYIPFNAYARKCLGQAFAMQEVRLVLFESVRHTKWTVDPNCRVRMSGGNLFFPMGLKILLEDLRSEC